MTTLALDDYFYRIWDFKLNDYKPNAFLDTVVFKGRTVSFPDSVNCCLELKTSYIDSQLDTVFENDFIFFPQTESLAFFDKDIGLNFLVGSANVEQDEYFRVGTTHNPLQALEEILSYVDTVKDLKAISDCLKSFKKPTPEAIINAPLPKSSERERQDLEKEWQEFKSAHALGTAPKKTKVSSLELQEVTIHQPNHGFSVGDYVNFTNSSKDPWVLTDFSKLVDRSVRQGIVTVVQDAATFNVSGLTVAQAMSVTKQLIIQKYISS